MHLAEFNKGILKYDWEDPRVADFTDNVDRVNAVAQRSDGFVWMLDADGMEAAQLDPAGPLGGTPRTASTLSVWRALASLEHFVWNTVHKAFYARAGEWYDPHQGLRMVLWWVPEGHSTTIAEAVERIDHLAKHGDSDFAFGWSYAKQTSLARS